MLDVQTLEKRWLKYKIRIYTPYLGSLALIGMVLIVYSVLQPIWHSSDENKRTSSSIQNTSEASPVSHDTTTVLEPSMTFINSFETPNIQTKPVVSAHKSTEPTVAVPKSMPITKSAMTPAPLPTRSMLTVPEPVEDDASNNSSIEATVPKNKPAIVSTNHGGTISVTRSDSKLDIEELQQRFKETSNANLGLFIARYYYDRGNYNDSYNYALKTNAINSKIDESWILFSKSLIKLGKTDQARKTLQLYISQSNSDSAKELLNNLDKGSFR
ncbi:MAG: tol-pal system YbgF family protein [Sulfuricurvum sp.]